MCYMQKEAFEPTGLIPRSIIRTFDRFVQQLLPGTEKIAIQEYRISRYQILVSIKSLFTLICIPLFVTSIVKSFILTPVTEHFWNSGGGEIFINEYQEKRAFIEMQEFADKIYFDSLISDPTLPTIVNDTKLMFFDVTSDSQLSLPSNAFENEKENISLQTQFQRKSLEIANAYNKQSILAITSLLSDIVTFFTVYMLFILMKPQIIILKSFCTESIYSLSDTTKSFLLILGMDLLVGFHSPRGWEIVLENVLRHLGLPENENFILLFVALFPVFLDTVFKYWIFRYLNKISPSTVVTYHSMLE